MLSESYIWKKERKKRKSTFECRGQSNQRPRHQETSKKGALVNQEWGDRSLKERNRDMEHFVVKVKERAIWDYGTQLKDTQMKHNILWSMTCSPTNTETTGPQGLFQDVKLQTCPQWVREQFVEGICMLFKKSFFSFALTILILLWPKDRSHFRDWRMMPLVQVIQLISNISEKCLSINHAFMCLTLQMYCIYV